MSTRVNPTAICLPIVQFFMNPSDSEDYASPNAPQCDGISAWSYRNRSSITLVFPSPQRPRQLDCGKLREISRHTAEAFSYQLSAVSYQLSGLLTDADS